MPSAVAASSAPPRGMAELLAATPVEHLVGRFGLLVPAAMRRVGRESLLRSSVYLREVEWTHSGHCEEEWSNWLQRLAERKPPPGVREVIAEQREIAPGCRAVLAHESEYDRDIRTWFALQNEGTHGVWLECAQEPRAPHRALFKLATVARSYLRLDEQTRLEPQEWFYLERGAVALPPLGQEEFLVQFDGYPMDVRLELCSKVVAVSEPDEGLMARLQRAVALGSPGELKVVILRAGSRIVAGLDGEELIFQVEDGHNLHMSWGWWCPGRPGNSRAPRVELTLHSTHYEHESKTRLWDATLDSMRYLRP